LNHRGCFPFGHPGANAFSPHRHSIVFFGTVIARHWNDLEYLQNGSKPLLIAWTFPAGRVMSESIPFSKSTEVLFKDQI